MSGVTNLHYASTFKEWLDFSGEAIGFIPFKDAYGLYCGFFDSAPEEASFRDNLLHKDHGLCVIITVVFGK